jgi:hypothetical protein
MSGSKVLRTVLIIALAILVAKFLWTGFFAVKAVDTAGKVQVNIAVKDVERIALILDMLWDGYDLDNTDDDPFKTTNYGQFYEKVEEVISQYSGMASNLPDGKNFAEFSYSGSRNTYLITAKARDKNRTLVHGTPERVWHE